MRIAVIYYSLTGNVRMIAENVAEATGGGLLEVELKTPLKPSGFMRFVKGGKDALLKRTPEIAPLDLDAENYDLFFIGTPVWAATCVPALRAAAGTLGLRGKKVAFFASSMGGKGRAFRDLAELFKENEVIDTMHFVEPLRGNREEEAQNARDWASKVMQKTVDAG